MAFLTDEDKKILKSFGNKKKDIEKIEKAVAVTDFEIDDKPIDLVSVLRIMDRKEFLSGMSRSAFHFSAARETVDGRVVLFDSSRLFK